MRPAADLVDRVKARSWFRCPCGGSSRGDRMSWPTSFFYVDVPRVCSRGLLCEGYAGPTGSRLSGGVIHDHLERVGPFPPETPVCTTHPIHAV